MAPWNFIPPIICDLTCDFWVLQQEQDSAFQGGARGLCSCTKHIQYGADQEVHGKHRLFSVLFLGMMY